jgi:hypothetical protein
MRESESSYRTAKDDLTQEIEIEVEGEMLILKTRR